MVNYEQLQLVLVEISQEHSVSYNDEESVPVIMYSLGTGDLVDVLVVVRDINNWKELGLQLGLLYPSLERIDLEQRGRITLCITMMLSAWLLQQDKCLTEGSPFMECVESCTAEYGRA